MGENKGGLTAADDSAEDSVEDSADDSGGEWTQEEPQDEDDIPTAERNANSCVYSNYPDQAWTGGRATPDLNRSQGEAYV